VGARRSAPQRKQNKYTYEAECVTDVPIGCTLNRYQKYQKSELFYHQRSFLCEQRVFSMDSHASTLSSEAARAFFCGAFFFSAAHAHFFAARAPFLRRENSVLVTKTSPCSPHEPNAGRIATPSQCSRAPFAARADLAHTFACFALFIPLQSNFLKCLNLSLNPAVVQFGHCALPRRLV
jgi:hypothetical protein